MPLERAAATSTDPSGSRSELVPRMSLVPRTISGSPATGVPSAAIRRSATRRYPLPSSCSSVTNTPGCNCRTSGCQMPADFGIVFTGPDGTPSASSGRTPIV